MVVMEVRGKFTEWAERDRVDYFAHSNDVPLLSIQDDEGLALALAKINELVDMPELSLGSERYLDALSDLVSVYEDKAVQFPPLDGVTILRHLMEEGELHQKDIADVLGAKSVVSEILSGKRSLNLGHAKKLGAYFGLPPSIFVDFVSAEEILTSCHHRSERSTHA